MSSSVEGEHIDSCVLSADKVVEESEPGIGPAGLSSARHCLGSINVVAAAALAAASWMSFGAVLTGRGSSSTNSGKLR